ncbi:MAG: hypothetical protein KDB27_30920 [Planctomycetales bacterium]|nr:hypothetical protein [Planctomycetales bacterium]
MMRLALPAVLIVVLATSGSLAAECSRPACDGNLQGCHGVQPACNTNFPGDCCEEKNLFAYSLWSDYCQTKRRGPVCRLQRPISFNNCGPAVSSNCNACQSDGVAVPNSAEAHADSLIHVQPYPATTPENPADLPTPAELRPEPAEIDAPEVGAPEVGAPEVGAPEVGAQEESESRGAQNSPGIEPPELPDLDVNKNDAGSAEESEEAIRRSVDEAIDHAL